MGKTLMINFGNQFIGDKIRKFPHAPVTVIAAGT